TGGGDECASRAVHLARRSSAEGGDSEIGGDGDGVVMARSLRPDSNPSPNSNVQQQQSRPELSAPPPPPRPIILISSSASSLDESPSSSSPSSPPSIG
ncbi:hypothetical protein Tco_0495584, partial [Tanacetum coccineum]